MPETTPPPAKHHGGGAFVGAVILMLLAMGGLLYWKFGRTPDAPPPAPSAPPAPQAPVFEAPPPPPPPAEPDAGKKEEGPRKRLGGSGAGACGGTCKGDVSPTLRTQLAGTAGSARGCYERALRQNSTLQGRLVVSVRISSSGSVCSASLANDSLGDPSVASCVLQKFRSGAFAPPVGGCADVQVPISFMPKTK